MADALSLVYVASMYPLAIGGAQIHMHEMVKLLTRAGHTVRVVTMASRHRTDWLRITTVCADPGRNCNCKGISAYRHGFDLATMLRILPWRWSTTG
jgi:uncharacterized NAD(P)/FAD-binding protein YdhS